MSRNNFKNTVEKENKLKEKRLKTMERSRKQASVYLRSVVNSARDLIAFDDFHAAEKELEKALSIIKDITKNTPRKI